MYTPSDPALIAYRIDDSFIVAYPIEHAHHLELHSQPLYPSNKHRSLSVTPERALLEGA
jgi:hypothetical protein